MLLVITAKLAALGGEWCPRVRGGHRLCVTSVAPVLGINRPGEGSFHFHKGKPGSTPPAEVTRIHIICIHTTKPYTSHTSVWLFA